MDPVEGYAFANWNAGYGDFHLVPDLATLRTAAWADRTAYRNQASKLAQMFRENFDRYGDEVSAEIRAAEPKG